MDGEPHNEEPKDTTRLLSPSQENVEERTSSIDTPLPPHQAGSNDFTVITNDNHKSAISSLEAPDELPQQPATSTAIETDIFIPSPKPNMGILAFFKKAINKRHTMTNSPPTDTAFSDHNGSPSNSPVLPKDNNEYLTLSTPRQQTDMAVLLTPVRGKLEKLRDTTPESMPPYSPHLRVNVHSQVVKARLLPVGEFIVREILEKAEEKSKGLLELKLWYVYTFFVHVS